MHRVGLLLLFLTARMITAESRCEPRGESLAERVRRWPVVFHGLTVQSPTITEDGGETQFWMIETFKGSKELAKVLNIYPQHDVVDLKDK